MTALVRSVMRAANDSGDGRAKLEQAFLELSDHIDRTYRTKPAEDLMVEP